MLVPILAIVIALVAWSLHLMQQAVDHREFSLMLAGTLVAFSAAALVGVYFLMGNYVGYLTRTAHNPTARASYANSATWVLPSSDWEDGFAAPLLQTAIPLDAKQLPTSANLHSQ